MIMFILTNFGIILNRIKEFYLGNGIDVHIVIY